MFSMPNPSTVTKLSLFSFLVCLLILPGCGRSGSKGDNLVADQNKTNLQRVCTLYRFYQSKHGWQGPADEAAFRKFIDEQSPTTMKRIGADASDIDGLLTSERDNEKFEILWAVAGSARAAEDKNRPAIVFEKTGEGGMRMTGFTGGAPREVSDSEYNKLKKQSQGDE